ncbi:NRDE protein-domain-containing protein [Globomyces pollinis-pini]|nr:NRDE protein-domain-containing protein [Globomyces pollinis-pini]
MCIVFFVQNYKGYKLIVAGNRDEQFERKTDRIHFWPNTDILGGTDTSMELKSDIEEKIDPNQPNQKEYGTWMAMNKRGRYGFLTNVRNLQAKQDKKSRGYLIHDFLKHEEENVEDFLKQLESSKSEYNGFNLVLGDQNGMYYIGNGYDGPIENKLKEGMVYGLTNGTLSTQTKHTEWAKSKRGQDLFKEIIEGEYSKEEMISRLFRMLEDVGCDGGNLDQICVNTIQNKLGNYGTRTHTVIVVDAEQVHYEERESAGYREYMKGVVSDDSCEDIVFQFELV